MLTNAEFIQTVAFARQDGAMVGAAWIASFACFVGEFSHPGLSLASLVLALGSLVLLAVRVRKFRDGVQEGLLSFRRAWFYAMLIFFYAALLFALAQTVYFQFIDHGYLMDQYATMLSMPEYDEMVRQMYGVDSREIITMMRSTIEPLSAVEIALQFFTLNVIGGAILSVPVALAMRKTAAGM